MHFDRSHGDVEAHRNLLVGEALLDQIRDLLLTRREAAVGSIDCVQVPFDKGLGNLWRQVSAPFQRDVYGPLEFPRRERLLQIRCSLRERSVE